MPLNTFVTDSSIAQSMVLSIGLTMNGIVIKPMAVGNAFSIVSASKPPTSKDKSAGNLETNKLVAFTMTRMKLPGQKTEASICQVTVSKPTITPSFMPFSLFALIALSNVSARTYTAATPYVAGTPNGGNQAAKASPHSFAYPIYLKGESL